MPFINIHPYWFRHLISVFPENVNLEQDFYQMQLLFKEFMQYLNRVDSFSYTYMYIPKPYHKEHMGCACK